MLRFSPTWRNSSSNLYFSIRAFCYLYYYGFYLLSTFYSKKCVCSGPSSAGFSLDLNADTIAVSDDWFVAFDVSLPNKLAERAVNVRALVFSHFYYEEVCIIIEVLVNQTFPLRGTYQSHVKNLAASMRVP